MDNDAMAAYRQALGSYHEQGAADGRLEALRAAETGGYPSGGATVTGTVTDIGRLRAEVQAVPKREEPLAAPSGPKSIRRLHALHRSRVDVYDDGNPEHKHLIGEWIVEYLPTEALDPTIKPEIERLQVTGDETALMDFLVAYLERCLYAWNLDEPINRESIIGLRPVLQMQLVNALQRDAVKKSKSA